MDTIREEFEQWFRGFSLDDVDEELKRYGTGYASHSVDCAWIGWQAAIGQEIKNASRD